MKEDVVSKQLALETLRGDHDSFLVLRDQQLELGNEVFAVDLDGESDFQAKWNVVREVVELAHGDGGGLPARATDHSFEVPHELGVWFWKIVNYPGSTVFYGDEIKLSLVNHNRVWIAHENIGDTQWKYTQYMAQGDRDVSNRPKGLTVAWTSIDDEDEFTERRMDEFEEKYVVTARSALETFERGLGFKL